MAFNALFFKFILLISLAILPTLISSQRSIGKTYDRIDDISADILPEPRKRPFCNAFTGCGRKRSSPPQEQLMQENKNFHKIPMDDGLDSVLDISSEPAMDELSRQIMSEAKMWEAIQEAGAELMRRRQYQKNIYPGPINTQ